MVTRRFEMILDNQFVNTALIVDEAPVPIVQYTVSGIKVGQVRDLGVHSLESLGYSVEGYAGWLRKVGYVEVVAEERPSEKEPLDITSHYPKIGCTFDE